MGEIGVEEVGIDVTGGGGIEVEVEGKVIEVGGVVVEGIVIRGGDEEIRGEEIGVDGMDRDGKMCRLLERRDFLGEKNNFEKLEGTCVEEEEDCDRTFSTVVTCVKACLRRNEVMKLEVSLAISAWTRSTQAEKLKGGVDGVGEEGIDIDKDFGI